MRNDKQRKGIKIFITGGDNTSFIANRIFYNEEYVTKRLISVSFSFNFFRLVPARSAVFFCLWLSGTIDRKKENCAAGGKFRLVENSLYAVTLFTNTRTQVWYFPLIYSSNSLDKL